jgi:hypothetical protein
MGGKTGTRWDREGIMSETTGETDARCGTRTYRRPPEVLPESTALQRSSDGMRAGYGLDWLLLRADGSAVDRRGANRTEPSRR